MQPGPGLASILGSAGETVEGVTEGLADQFQPIEDTDGRQDMRGGRALTTAPFQEATLAHLRQEGVEPQEFRLPSEEPGPELA